MPAIRIKVGDISDYLLHAHYLVIEAVSRRNRTMFWKKIWAEKVLAIVMIYECDEDVRKNS